MRSLKGAYMESDRSPTVKFASFYDFYDGPENRGKQIELYKEIAQEAGGPILELACGTGIISLELARAGFRVVGLDISPDMLEIFQEKVSREDADIQARIRLVQGDMKDFQLDEDFGGIFIPTNSFGYLTELEAQLSCLKAIRAHLKEKGMMVIEERFYTPERLAGMKGRERAVMLQQACVNPLTGKFTTFCSITAHIDFVTQTIYYRLFIDEVQEDGTVRRYFPPGRRSMHYFIRFELQSLIERAGFTVKELYGGWGRQSFGPTSSNMIFVSEKV